MGVEPVMSILSRLFRRGSQDEDLDCQEVKDLASDYVDEEMEEPLAVRVRRHLSFCPPCQSFISSFTSTVRALRSMPQERAPDAVRQRIIDETSQK